MERRSVLLNESRGMIQKNDDQKECFESNGDTRVWKKEKVKSRRQVLPLIWKQSSRSHTKQHTIPCYNHPFETVHSTSASPKCSQGWEEM
jgi:hypothetical protein